MRAPIQSPKSSETSEDMNASVSDIRFQDQDLDETEIGGQIYWLPPFDSSRVQDSWTEASGFRCQLRVGVGLAWVGAVGLKILALVF